MKYSCRSQGVIALIVCLSIVLAATGAVSSAGGPALLAPPDGTITTTRALTLRWAPNPGSDAPDGYNLEVDGNVITTTGTTWATTLDLGDHTWRVRAFNAVGYSDWPSLWTLRVAAMLCVPLGDVQMTGQATVTLNSTATFVATVTPISNTNQLLPTFPLTYTWTATDLTSQSHVITTEGVLTDTAAFTWSAEGLKNVAVTVANPCGVTVDATRAITVVAESETTQPIYLPLVMRNF
ncbi:MAG TPA: hypothetical protein PKH77_17005 [Anaerolineae bacterium]|nr:hypothetical protein [Anaerolineae bacterium]